jgi:hypothetical protein
MQRLLSGLFTIGPILFGLGFFAPVFAAFVNATNLPLPLGLDPLHAGLAIGFILGTIAAKRGTWI